jgi:hypothetical protein
MRLTSVTPADAMEVRGFEQHTLTCRECGDVEQRLVFSHGMARVEAPVEATAQAPVHAPLAALIEAPMQAPAEAPIAMKAEVPIKMELASPVEDSPLAPANSAPQAAPAAAPTSWVQASERLQLRQAAKVHEKTHAIAEAVVPAQPAAPAKLARELDDFDRLWESLAQPLPPPVPPTPVAATPDEPVARSSLAVSPKPITAVEKPITAVEMTAVEKPHAPPEPVPVVTAPQAEAPAWRQVPATPPALSPDRPEPERSGALALLRHAWTRAASLLRGKHAASKTDHADSMLQVDAGPLKW